MSTDKALLCLGLSAIELAYAEREGQSVPGEILHEEAWFGIGPGRAVRLMRSGLVVEYSTEYRAAVGVVSMDIGVLFFHISRHRASSN